MNIRANDGEVEQFRNVDDKLFVTLWMILSVTYLFGCVHGMISFNIVMALSWMFVSGFLANFVEGRIRPYLGE